MRTRRASSQDGVQRRQRHVLQVAGAVRDVRSLRVHGNGALRDATVRAELGACAHGRLLRRADGGPERPPGRAVRWRASRVRRRRRDSRLKLIVHAVNTAIATIAATARPREMVRTMIAATLATPISTSSTLGLTAGASGRSYGANGATSRRSGGAGRAPRSFSSVRAGQRLSPPRRPRASSRTEPARGGRSSGS